MSIGQLFSEKVAEVRWWIVFDLGYDLRFYLMLGISYVNEGSKATTTNCSYLRFFFNPTFKKCYGRVFQNGSPQVGFMTISVFDTYVYPFLVYKNMHTLVFAFKILYMVIFCALKK